MFAFCHQFACWWLCCFCHCLLPEMYWLLLFLCFYEKNLCKSSWTTPSLGVVVWLLNMERTTLFSYRNQNFLNSKEISPSFLSFFLSFFLLCVVRLVPQRSKQKKNMWRYERLKQICKKFLWKSWKQFCKFSPKIQAKPMWRWKQIGKDLSRNSSRTGEEDGNRFAKDAAKIGA